MEYGSTGFAVQVRKLIAAGERVTFDVRGDAFERLKPYIESEDMSGLMHAVVVPDLRDFVAAVVLAQAHSLRVSFSVSKGIVHVELGPQLS